MKLEISDMREVVSAAILQKLTEEQRNMLIQQAIAALLTPKEKQYGGLGETPLQTAFSQAVFDVARDVVKDQITKDPKFVNTLGTIVTMALAKAMAQDELVDGMASLFAQTFAKLARAERGY